MYAYAFSSIALLFLLVATVESRLIWATRHTHYYYYY